MTGAAGGSLFIRGVLLVLALALGETRPARAHALGAECQLRSGQLEVEAYYDDNTPARDARVWLEDAQGRRVLQGRTDSQGRWRCPCPEPGRYRLTVDAGAGHRTTLVVRVPALPGTATVPTDAAPQTPAAIPVAEGPSRAEFTRPPWTRMVLGLGIIGCLGLVGWGVLRWRRRRHLPEPPVVLQKPPGMS